MYRKLMCVFRQLAGLECGNYEDSIAEIWKVWYTHGERYKEIEKIWSDRSSRNIRVKFPLSITC
jgi:hypothetical protein